MFKEQMILIFYFYFFIQEIFKVLVPRICLQTTRHREWI